MAERLDILIDVDVRGSRDIKVLKGDLEDLGKAGKTGGDGVDKLSKSTGGLTGSLRGLVAGGLLAGAGAALFKFGRDALIAASDVEELQAKFNTVFKDLAGDVTAELETFADAANRSIFDLQGFAATLQDTFVPLGFARDEAADLSVELVKLAEDLASFNNLNTEDVVRDLQSALVGNTETLRKYGVVASQAAIEQEALESGLIANKNELDALTKAQAIYQLTVKGTTDAQGDAIETADSFANQTRGLKASFEELSVTIGQKLLPASSSAVGALTSFVDATTDTINATDTLSDAFKRGNISFKDLVRTSTLVSSGTISVGRAMRLLAQTQEENTLASGENADAYASLARSQTQFKGTVEELIPATRELAQITDDYREASLDYEVTAEQIADAEKLRAEAHEATGEALLKAEQAQANYFTQALESGDATVNLNEAIFESAQAAGASAGELAVLGGALGLYNDEQVEAALQAAILQTKIDELAQKYADGQITVSEMRLELQSFRKELLDIPTQKTFTLKIQSDTSGFNLPPGVRSEDVRFTQGGVGLQHGADFIVPPGFPNDSFGPIFVTSGERVQVTPAGATTNNNQSLTVNVNAGGGSAHDIGIAARDGLLEAAQALGIRGFN